jgi:hypothetical protein
MAKLTQVQFVVEDFGDDASEVTRLIGFEPTGVAVCGFSSLPQRRSWWFELSELVPDGIAEQVAALLSLLELHAESVRKVAGRFRTRISITVDDRDWIWPDDPTGPRIGNFELPPNLTAAAAKLGIGFAVQFTCGLEREAARCPAQTV